MKIKVYLAIILIIINTKDKNKVRLVLNDEAQKIILNTKGFMKDLSEELLEFLEYVETSTDYAAKHSKGKLVSSIHKRVQEVKNDISMEVHILKKCEAQSRSYMTLLERDREKIEEGRDEERKLIIIKQYNKGISIEYIAEINEFDVEYVKEVVKNNTSKSNN
ncbi:hypothetical protein [Clostridium beijerinckii]|uniref:Uncharacterized protein n=1 Tax=Clostridium beijerinckii TaxID=1520 RepID=A0A1S8RYN8_CLOBE|nr:putative transposase/invertase (TIGR01784 family) [Clostridium beijerinckii]OOM58318.1 hypothetical protein CLBCK_40610 [Clostridium beijerinckii]